MMRLALIIALAFIALSTTASATVLHVPSQYSTIQAGIDTNGNCTTNGIDVTYLVAYLKGIGAPPVRPNCEQITASSGKY